MTFMIVAAFIAFVGVGLTRTWKLRSNPEAWQPWLACVIASVGISTVLFDRQIDALLGGNNWVFILETWSVFFAYALMTETCRAVGRGAPVQVRRWVLSLVTAWCIVLTVLFASLEGREGTRSHFVRDMFEQPQALAIGLMYSAGIVLLGILPLFWLRYETGASAWLIRIGSALVIIAHFARLLVTPIDFMNRGEAAPVEVLLYGLFVPTFYLGLASFAIGLMGLSLRRWYRESFQLRRHMRRLHDIAKVHHLDLPGDTSPVSHLIAIEDATRAGDIVLTENQVAAVANARSWLARTHDAGPRLRYAENSPQ